MSESNRKIPVRLSPEQHRERHKALHEFLDELVADFITCTGKLPSKTTLDDFMRWSYQQTIEPMNPGGPKQ